MFAILSVNIPAQTAHESAANGGKTTVSSQPVFALGILDFFNFLDFGSLFGSQAAERQKTPPINPFDESEGKGGVSPKLPEPQAAVATPCTSTNVTRSVPTATYPTIQAAINAANPSGGDTIQIAAGTFTEQLVVNKCVFINGAGQGSTIIQSPAALANSSVVGITNTSSIVEVRSNAYVTMNGLTVTGPVPFDKDVYGIFVVETATLKMINARVTAIHKEAGIDGVQNGNAVKAGSVFFNQIGSLDFTNVTIDDYQKTGIIASRAGSTVAIANSTFTGAGAQTAIGQNGIQVSDGVTATITNNTISDNVCDNPACSFNTYYSYGILAFDMGSLSITGNTFNNNDAVLYTTSPGITTNVDSNTVTQVRYSGFDLDQGTTNLSNNFIIGSALGPITGVGVLSYNGNTANTVANLHSNSITGSTQAGISVDDFNTADAVSPTIASADFNRIAGNAIGIDNNTSSSTVPQTNNFWGCNQGPTGGAPSCDTTDGLVDVSTPYLKLTDTTAPLPTSVSAGGTKTISTSLRINSAGTNTFTATNHLPNPIASTPSSANNPNGIPVNFSVPAYGSVVSPKPLIDGLASTTFTGGTVDGGDQTAVITAKVDNATSTANVIVLDAIAPTVAPSTGVLASSSIVNFTVTFSEPVIGVDAADFNLVSIAPGNVVASITNVTGTGNTRTVQVTVASGMGMIRLDVLNNGTIKDTASAQNPLAAGSTGTPVSVDVQMPTVTINQAATQPDPTSSSPITFTVVFSEPVTGFDASDVNLSASTAGGTLVAAVSGSGANYTVTVTGMTTSGTVIASIPANAAVDASNNGTAASTSTDNSVTYLQAIVTNINTGLTYATIQAANDAPQTLNGHTIRASAGVYLERANITKSLTIQGAQFGNDARTGRTNVNNESTVGISTGAFNVQSAVTVTIDGFRLTGANAAGDTPAILLLGNPGDLIVNNIIEGNSRGAYFSTPNTTFRHNRLNNTGDGFFGGVDNTTVEENLFTGGHPDGAVNTTVSSGDPTVDNYRLINNESQASGNFGVIFATVGSNISGNTITNTTGSALFLGGGNSNLNVQNNTFTGTQRQAIIVSDFGFGYGNNSNVNFIGNNVTRSIPDSADGFSTVDYRGVAGSNQIFGNTITLAQAAGTTTNPTGYGVRVRGSGSGNFEITGNVFNGGGIVSSTTTPATSGVILSSNQAAASPATNGGQLPVSSVININCNSFTGLQNGIVAYNFVGNTAGGLPIGIDVNANGDNFLGNSLFGINNGGTSETIDATNSYWNSPSGPSGAGPGSGDAVSANVTFTPFLTSPSTCAPVNNVPPTQSVNQDTTLTFTGANQISVTDLDVGSTPVTVTLSVTNGTLTLSQTTGLTFTAGDGTADATMTFSGTLANVNAALNGLAFNPTAGFVGSSTLTITSSSTGSPGVGGGTQTDTDTVTINVLDAVAPTVLSINRGTPTAQNTNATSVIFNVTFSEPVTGVDPFGADFRLVGTIERAAATIIVSADTGATRTVTVTGYTGDGTLGLNLVDDDSIVDAQGNRLGGTGIGSTGNGSFTGQTYNIDLTRPTVTINQAAGQPDPTSSSPINFTVVFSESVSNFVTGDVSFTGSTVGGTLIGTVTGSGTTYNVAVTGMTSSGMVIATIADGAASDAVGNLNTASTSIDNVVTYSLETLYALTNSAGTPATQNLVTFSSTAPVTIFSTTPITGLPTGETLVGIDFRPSTIGAAPNRRGVLYGITVNAGIGRVYTINTTNGAATLTGVIAATLGGTPIAINGTEFGVDFNPVPDRIRFISNAGQNLRINPDNGVTAIDGTLGSPGPVRTGVTGAAYSNNDNNTATGTMLYDIDSTTDQLLLQNPPNDGTLSSIGSLGIDVTEVNGFDISGTTATAYAALQTASASPSSLYTVNLATGAVSPVGIIGGGLTIRGLTAAPPVLFVDNTSPDVTINQAAAQIDPTSTSPVNFTAVFTEPVSGFATGDVTVSGTAFGLNSNPNAVVTQIAPNDGTTYNVAVSGMNQSGTVTVAINAGVAVDIVGNPNTASTSTDNTVTFVLVDTAVLVSPVDTKGWTFVQENAGVASGSFVTGPATPPIGTGSTRLSVDATAGEAFFDAKPAYANVRFDSITNLTYSSYQTVSNGAAAPAFQFNLETDVTAIGAAFQGRLVYEPYQDTTNTVQTGVWQDWNALKPTARFWASPNANTTVDDVCPQSSPCTRAFLLANFPNLGIRAFAAPSGPPVGVILFKAGSGGGVLDSNVDNFAFGVNSANTTFNFDETPPSISIDSVSVVETNSGTTTANFTITQSAVSQLPTTVTVNTASGTATAGSDFVAISNQTFTIPVGMTTVPVSVTVNGDTTVEGNETFTVNLTNAVNAAIMTGSGTGTITNDDVAISFSSATYSVTEGTPTATITVNRNGVNGTVLVNYATADGTATAGSDYTATSGQLSFASTDTSQSFTIPINDDTLSELAETVNLSLSLPAGSTATLVAPSTAVLTINDNESNNNGQVSISGVITQNGSGLNGVTVTLSGTSSGTTTTSTINGLNGSYSFTGLAGNATNPNNNYLVTPSASGLVFDPTQRSYVSLGMSVTNANFVAYTTIPRNLRIVNTNQSVIANSVTVPIVLDSLGNENALSFSLNYDTARLSNPVVACGSDAPGCQVSSNNVGGTLGIEFARADDVNMNPTAFTAGNGRQVVTVTFTPSPGTASSTPITFGDTPTIRDINDVDGNSLLANYINGSVIFAQGIEGDVAGRFTGNGLLSSGDVTILRSFVSGAATPDPGFNEFQRADVAPAGTKGGGTLTSADITVLRNYIANGILTPAGGPTQATSSPSPAAELKDQLRPSKDAAAATGDIRLVNTDGSRGMTVSVPITLDSNGTENGFSFSIQFEQAKLSNPVVTFGSDVPPASAGSLLTLNMTQVANGRLGIVGNLPENATFNGAGTKQIIIVTFNVDSMAPAGNSPITFGNSPQAQDLNNNAGDTLPFNFVSGNVNILGATASGVSIGGKVQNMKGRGVANTQITMTNSRGEMRTVRSNPFGYFKFTDVPAGEAYTVNIRSKQYTFATQVVNVSQNLDNLVFTADK